MKRVMMNFRKYLAIARINLQNSLAYSGEMVYRSFFMVVILYVFIQLWKTTYRQLGTATISGLTLENTLWYLVMTETIILSKLSFSTRMSQEVKDGSIAYTLGRPYNYLLYHLAYGLGDTLLRLLINFTAGALLVTIFVAPMSFSVMNIVPLVITIFLALMVDFCIEGLIGLSAFITEDVSSIQLIYGKLLFILGGMLLPLDFFPQWLRTISLMLPFNYIVYAPARLFVQFNMDLFLEVTRMQCFWIAVFAFLLWGLFRTGLRHVAVNGG